MSATRFFVSGVYAPGDLVPLAADDARKLRVVLRRVDGDTVEVIDSSGRAFAATLTLVSEGARARLERELAAAPAPALRITLAQALPKGAKMDFIVEKATELGIERIIPFASERTAGDGARAGKVERWRRLSRSAAAQCGRADVPHIDDPLTLQTLVPALAAYDVVLVPWELAAPRPLRERLPELLSGAARAAVVIGPEGGLAAAEAEALEAAGGMLVSLGRRILRTETAGLVACAAMRYEAGEI